MPEGMTGEQPESVMSRFSQSDAQGSENHEEENNDHHNLVDAPGDYQNANNTENPTMILPRIDASRHKNSSATKLSP